MRHVIALLLTVTVIQLHAEPQISGTPSEITQYLQPEPATVSLTGEGEVHVQADRAIINILVTTENKYFSEALQKNESIRNNLIKTLTGKGVSAEHIVSSKFSSTPEQSNWSDKIKNYKVEHQVKVTVETGEQFNAVAALIDQTPEMRLQQIQPDHSSKDEQSAKALSEAFKKVEKRKAVFEQYLGQKLTPKTASEKIFQQQPDTSYAYRQMQSVASSGRMAKQITSIPGEAMDFMPTSSFGELSYRVIVSVDYYVGSKPKLTSR